MKVELPGILERCFQSPLEAFHHSHLLGVVAVKFETEIAQTESLHSGLHHVEGSEFLGHEEHRFALVKCGGNEIGDRLGLSGSGRTLDDEVFPLDGVDQGRVLGAVRHVHQRKLFIDVLYLVDGVLVLVNTLPDGSAILTFLSLRALNHRVH